MKDMGYYHTGQVQISKTLVISSKLMAKTLVIYAKPLALLCKFSLAIYAKTLVIYAKTLAKNLAFYINFP